MEVVAWLEHEYDVGRGHALASSHVVRSGVSISGEHVGSTGVRRDGSAARCLDARCLDAIAARQREPRRHPAPWSGGIAPRRA